MNVVRATKLEIEQKENEELRKDIAGWLNWVYYLPEDWRPIPMIEVSKKLLKNSARRRGIKVEDKDA